MSVSTFLETLKNTAVQGFNKLGQHEIVQNRAVIEATLAEYGLTTDNVTKVLTANYWPNQKENRNGKHTCLMITNAVYEDKHTVIEIPSPLIKANEGAFSYYKDGGISKTANALGFPILDITNHYHERKMAFNPNHVEVLNQQALTNNRPSVTLVDSSGMTHDVYGTLRDIMDKLDKKSPIDIDKAPAFDYYRGTTRISKPDRHTDHTLLPA